MLTTVAVLPQPPLLVPELAAGAVEETASLRAACLAAAAGLGAAAPRWIAVGADGGGRRTVEPAARGTFAGFGVDVSVALDTRGAASAAGAPGSPDSRAATARLARPDGPTRATGSPDSRDRIARLARPDRPTRGGWGMALPLLVAGWVAGSAGVEVVIRGELVAPDAPPGECAGLGAALAAECAAADGPVGLLVVGDGSAAHTEKAPRHLDERAGPFDRAVAAALAAADAAGLAALDPVLAAELCAVGRAPWQVLAGAAGGAGWRGELLYSDAPFGVAYHVAVWERAAATGPGP